MVNLLDDIKNLKKSLNHISVYDLNTYTAIELYYALATKTNEVITELSRFEGVISDEIIEQNEKLTYLLGEGLTTEVGIKIYEMVKNGVLDSIINDKLMIELNEKINKKADSIDVRLKADKIGLNDLDNETIQAITNQTNTININTQIGNEAVTNNNIMPRQITADKIHFMTTYNLQLLRYSSAVDGYYKHGTSEIASSDTTCKRYEPIRIYSGVTYYLKNVYGYFCNIKYDNSDTYTAITESTSSSNFEGNFTASSNGFLYISAKKSIIETGNIPMVTNVNKFPTTEIYGEFETGINSLVVKDYNYENNSITPLKTTFAREVKQYYSFDSLTLTKYYKHNSTEIGTSSDGNSGILNPFRVYKGETYFYQDLYAYFCNIKYDDGTIVSFSDSTNKAVSGQIDVTQNGYMYISVNTAVENTKPRISNSKKGLLTSNVGTIGNEIINNLDLIEAGSREIKTNIIKVSKDGTGDFNKITQAVNSINDSSEFNQYEIHIYTGTYDLVEEFGGQTWVNSISDTDGEMQGLLLPNFVHLIGHGSVNINCMVSNENATESFAKCVSTINVNQSNRIEGIVFRGQNTRYVIHDETGNKYHNLTRVLKNCRFIHKGNKQGFWSSFKAMGGGFGSGGRYDIINCDFVSPYVPFTYHNNENQASNFMNIDGCTFSGNNSSQNYDIGFGYYKLNDSTDKNYITIKNCIYYNGISVYQESSSVESTNVFDVRNINNITRG